jgi:hypothetical protein
MLSLSNNRLTQNLKFSFKIILKRHAVISFGFVIVVDHAQLSSDSSLICCSGSLYWYHHVNISRERTLPLSYCRVPSIIVFMCINSNMLYYIVTCMVVHVTNNYGIRRMIGFINN